MPRVPGTDYSAVDRLDSILRRGTEALRRKNEQDFAVSQQILGRAIAREQQQIRTAAADEFQRAISPRTEARLRGVGPSTPTFPTEDERRTALDRYIGRLLSTGPEGTKAAGVVADVYQRPQNPPSIQREEADVVGPDGKVLIEDVGGIPHKFVEQIDLRTSQPIPGTRRSVRLIDPSAGDDAIIGRYYVRRAEDLKDQLARERKALEAAIAEANRYVDLSPEETKGLTPAQVRAENKRITTVREGKNKEAEAIAGNITRLEQQLGEIGVKVAPYVPLEQSQGGKGGASGQQSGTPKPSGQTIWIRFKVDAYGEKAGQEGEIAEEEFDAAVMEKIPRPSK